MTVGRQYIQGMKKQVPTAITIANRAMTINIRRANVVVM